MFDKVVVYSFVSLAVDSTLFNIGTSDFGGKGVDSDPQKRENGCKKNGPDHHNGWCSVLASHETFEERVEMDDHPECKEELTKEGTPWLVPTVDGIGDTCNNSNQVYDEKCCGRDEKGCPFEHVQFCKVSIFIWCLWGNSEVGVNSSKHFEQTLEHGKKMGRNTTDNPKLFVSPPLVDSNTAPPHLKYTGCEDGKKERDKPYTCNVTNLQNKIKGSFVLHKITFWDVMFV